MANCKLMQKMKILEFLYYTILLLGFYHVRNYAVKRRRKGEDRGVKKNWFFGKWRKFENTHTHLQGRPCIGRNISYMGII